MDFIRPNYKTIRDGYIEEGVEKGLKQGRKEAEAIIAEKDAKLLMSETKLHEKDAKLHENEMVLDELRSLGVPDELIAIARRRAKGIVSDVQAEYVA